MNAQTNEAVTLSRRTLLKESAAVLAGGAVGAAGAYAAAPAAAAVTAVAEPPPLPWKWVRLDPLEAGRRAYRFYGEPEGDELEPAGAHGVRHVPRRPHQGSGQVKTVILGAAARGRSCAAHLHRPDAKAGIEVQRRTPLNP